MKQRHELLVQMVPIEQIVVVNSRTRGREKFKKIVANVASVGMKKPVTLARREPKDGQPRYDLVCGEGRIEACKALGQTEVPALIIEATREELLLMSLAENIARRSRTTIEMAREIAAMRQRGQTPAEIAKKVDLDVTYVNGILRLLKHGEERLVTAVEKRQLPLSLAITVSESNDAEVQKAMADAYERGDLRGKQLLAARRLLEKRRAKGKRSRTSGPRGEAISADSLLKAYKKEATRQQMLITRAKQCETRLRFVVSAVKELLADEAFVNLLRAEGLFTLPAYLSSEINRQEVVCGA